ncbi:MAG: DUF368 domain-containing protein [Chloroflexi bacterium]|jgi:putative membrane protein|nr:DUF368 domain-containing protein [Chloroflexota bacterium]
MDASQSDDGPLKLKDYIWITACGLFMGTANIIPGVSGGTVALITGIYERLINSVKSFDVSAIKLIFSGKIKTFIEYTNLRFLATIIFGMVVAMLSLAKLLDPLFDEYPVYVWAFFFGLILASVYFVGKTVEKWTAAVIVALLIGCGCALAISFISDVAGENDSVWYVFLCGAVAICSMILPGLSGSYVLLLMGNYELIVIDALSDISDFHFQFGLLIPFLMGAVFGIAAFSRIISWIFKKYRDVTISLLTGFVFGSLGMLWPWKDEITETLSDGSEKVAGYDRYLPDSFDGEVMGAIGLMIVGILVIWVFEKLAASRESDR